MNIFIISIVSFISLSIHASDNVCVKAEKIAIEDFNGTKIYTVYSGSLRGSIHKYEFKSTDEKAKDYLEIAKLAVASKSNFCVEYEKFLSTNRKVLSVNTDVTWMGK